MQQSKLAVVVLSQNSALPEETVQEAVSAFFSEPETPAEICLIRYAKGERADKFNEWFAQNLNDAERIILLDVDQVPPDSLTAITDYIRSHPADICCICDPVPKEKTFSAHRDRFARYLSENSAVLFFSEKAVRHMRTSDTTNFTEEALQTASLSVHLIGKGRVGIVKDHPGLFVHLRLLRCVLNIGSILFTCAAAALTGAIVFFILLLAGLFKTGLIGCIVCVHIFLISAAALLIRWYRRSAAHEKKKHEHPYVEESHLK